MRKQPTKKKYGIHQIYGLNGCSNIIQEKKLIIIRIDIMAGGNAEKKKWVNNLAKIKSYQIHKWDDISKTVICWCQSLFLIRFQPKLKRKCGKDWDLTQMTQKVGKEQNQFSIQTTLI